MPNSGYFSSEHDKAIIDAGGFFCEACSVGKPAGEMSPDPRYCQGCYEFLLKEVELLPASKRPKWIPKAQRVGSKSIPVPQDEVLIMSTVKRKKTEVDIIPPAVSARTPPKRGPKHKPLPEDLVKQWAGEGMGAKAIATMLTGEGVEVSYKTIQRLLSGQRVMMV